MHEARGAWLCARGLLGFRDSTETGYLSDDYIVSGTSDSSGRKLASSLS